MASIKMPERLINFRVYNGKNDLLGLASVDLPEIEAMSDTVAGAGIAGEVETPVMGHYGAMACSFSWNSITAEGMKLSKPGVHEIDIRGAQQMLDTASSKFGVVPVRLTLRVTPKTVTLGTFEPGATTDTEQEFEVLYLKMYVNDKEVIEIDKYNFVAKFGGDDALADVRRALGLK